VGSSQRTNKKNSSGGATTDLTATDLNTFYGEFSTDLNYVSPVSKLTANSPYPLFDEYTVFSMLDNLKATATGLDELPSCFLQLAAPFLSALITQLFNASVSHSFVPY